VKLLVEEEGGSPRVYDLDPVEPEILDGDPHRSGRPRSIRVLDFETDSPLSVEYEEIQLRSSVYRPEEGVPVPSKRQNLFDDESLPRGAELDLDRKPRMAVADDEEVRFRM
jgi:hypothetical protein